MIDTDAVVRLAPGVRVHVVDDENGFVETPDGVHRMRGTRLHVLEELVLPRLDDCVRGADLLGDLARVMPEAEARRLLAGLDEQGLLTVDGPPRPPVQAAEVVVCGPDHLASHLVAVLDRTEGVQVRHLREPVPEEGLLDHPAALVVVATASLFDPWAGQVNELCVRRGQACLFFGVAHQGTAFAGPLWDPRRVGACYECLRTRVYSNSPHGRTWRSYTDSLAAAGKRAVPHEIPAWVGAALAGTAGERAAGWLADPDRDAADRLDWTEGDYTTPSVRHLLAVPTCPVCGPRQRLGDPVAELRHAVDDRVGIVHATTVRRAESGPAIYLSGSVSANLSLIKEPMWVTKNGGAAFTKQEAVNATIGEALERYAAGCYPAERLVFARWTELTEEAVPPEKFGLFSEEQYRSEGFPFTPFTSDTPIRWTRAVRWTDGAKVWVPASQTYLHYRRVPGESIIAPSISTGLAAAPSLREAVLSGLYEVLERDALAISWLHRLPPRPVPRDVIDASSHVAYHLERAKGWRVGFYDLSLDHSPSVVVAVMDYRGRNEQVMAFGSACRGSAVAAVEKAFLEATQGLTYVRRLLRQYQDWEVADDFSNVDEFNKHAILYTKYPRLREAAGYLVHPLEPPECSRPARADRESPLDLDALARGLDAAGHPVYVVDLTTPDVRQLGVTVVRVLVPGLQHLSGMHRFRLLGNPRLHTVAAALGYDSAPDNPYPHPLP